MKIAQQNLGTSALLVALALPAALWFRWLPSRLAESPTGFLLIWAVAISLSVVSARLLSRWCYILTGPLGVSFAFIFFIEALMP